MRMTMKERTDPHRPSALDPADYVFVGAADDHPGDSYMEIRHDVLAKHGVETGSSDRYSAVNVPFYDAREDGRPNFRCHSCGKHGSNIRYFTFFLHKPTKQVIVVGQICAKKLSLASKEDLDFQQRADEFRRMRDRHRWIDDHQEEYHFLREYDEQHSQDGIYVEFFESLWDKIQETGSLTDRQVEGLHRWMSRGKPWERQQELERERKSFLHPDNQDPHQQQLEEATRLLDADRHKAEVTHVSDTPTEAQIGFLQRLAEDLGQSITIPETRFEASELINDLKAKLYEKRQADKPEPQPATEKQITFIHKLMDQRKIELDARRQATSMIDNGLTKAQASQWIERLLELPEIDR